MNPLKLISRDEWKLIDKAIKSKTLDSNSQIALTAAIDILVSKINDYTSQINPLITKKIVKLASNPNMTADLHHRCQVLYNGIYSIMIADNQPNFETPYLNALLKSVEDNETKGWLNDPTISASILEVLKNQLARETDSSNIELIKNIFRLVKHQDLAFTVKIQGDSEEYILVKNGDYKDGVNHFLFMYAAGMAELIKSETEHEFNSIELSPEDEHVSPENLKGIVKYVLRRDPMFSLMEKSEDEVNQIKELAERWGAKKVLILVDQSLHWKKLAKDVLPAGRKLNNIQKSSLVTLTPYGFTSRSSFKKPSDMRAEASDR